MKTQSEQSPRRPIKTRGRVWVQKAAQALAKAGITPNQISYASIAFAAIGGLCLVQSIRTAGTHERIFFLLTTGACVQLRLLCNLLDGLVAIEGGLKTKSGEIYNDFPDRISDSLILIPMGYAVTCISWGRELGWAAGLLALMTAYVRTLGHSAGAPMDFRGPMAKQQRMAVATIACVISSGEVFVQNEWRGWAFLVALIVIAVGSAITALRRIRYIIQMLESI